MALNHDFQSIGVQFIKQYYTWFDDPTQRGNLRALYSADQSLMSFEGTQHQGAQKIMERFNALTFQRIQHLVTSVDCQPTMDGGVLINVMGQLKTDDDPAHSFSQVFVLKPVSGGAGDFFCQHDMFRLVIHNN